jgi:hypothetical protein
MSLTDFDEIRCMALLLFKQSVHCLYMPLFWCLNTILNCSHSEIIAYAKSADMHHDFVMPSVRVQLPILTL